MYAFPKTVLTAVFFVSLFISQAQNGNIFLKHYRQFPEGVDNQNSAVQQGKNGVIYFANSKGVLNYDGSKWALIPVPARVRSFGFHESSGKLFVGCQDNYGYINTDPEDYRESYISISGSGKPGMISDVVVCGEDVFFVSLRNLYQISIKEAREKYTFRCRDEQLFTGVFNFKESLFVNVWGIGLHQIRNGSMILLPGELFKEDHILFGVPFDAQNCLIGTESGKLYLFNGKTVQPYTTGYEDYLKSNLLAGVVSLSDKEICFSTLSGGCLVADRNTRKMLYVINYQSGLPDDEVFAVNKDKEGGLWITHEYGITRADETLPFRNFSLYPGLEGNILSILKDDDQLYVATSEGVFFLSKVKSYEELQRVIKKTSTKKILREEEQETRFSLFRKKKKAADSVEVQEEEEIVIRLAPAKNETVDNDDKTYAIHSVQYVFRKIPNINDKCRQLVKAGNRIIVVGNTGLYDIVNFQGKQLVKDFYIVNACYMPEVQSLYAGLKEGFLLLRRKGGDWENPTLTFLPFEITSLVSAGQYLWATGSGKLWRIEEDGNGKVISTKSFEIPEGFSEVNELRNHGAKLYLSSSANGIYFDPATGNFIPDNRITNNRVTVFSGQEAVTWIRMDSVWTAYHTDPSKKPFSLPILNFIQDLKTLYIDSENYVWMVDRSNNLIRLVVDQNMSNPQKFRLIVRQISDEKGVLLNPEDLVLDYQNSSVSFYFAAPHFKDEQGVLYQYKLEGMNEEWSAWNSNAVTRFPYLPPGDYVLRARAKNMEGQMSDEVRIEFKVYPPYWKTTGFYLLEILFFVALVTIAVLLNRRSRRGFFWAKFATFMTLIIIIEVIHRGVQDAIDISNADSPVLAVSADVLLALLISPIEKVLDLFISRKKHERKRVIKVVGRGIAGKLKMK